jgi:hypothetical protein
MGYMWGAARATSRPRPAPSRWAKSLPQSELSAMQQIFSQVGQIAQQLATVIWRVLEFIWSWSFGQVVRMFQMPFNSLPIWKQVLYVLVIGALAYFIYKIFKDLLKAVQSILSAIVSLISALIAMLPQIVMVGLIAFGGAWVITTVNPTWMPDILVGRP